MAAAAATIASMALPPSRRMASALWLARWWGDRHAVGRNVATVHKLSFLNESPAEHCKSCSSSERFVSLIKTMTGIFPLARYV